MYKNTVDQIRWYASVILVCFVTVAAVDFIKTKNRIWERDELVGVFGQIEDAVRIKESVELELHMREVEQLIKSFEKKRDSLNLIIRDESNNSWK